MASDFRHVVSNSFAVISAEQDIDGCCNHVVLTADRREDDHIEFQMDPKTARLVARQLNHFARLIDPPKSRRKSQAR